jgi:hypothetical protein
MSYIGNTQQNQSFVPAVDYFSGNGSTTAFTLSRPVKSVYELEVVVNNVQQNPSSAYTVNGSTITFTGAPSSGTNNIYVSYTSPNTQVVQPGQGTVGSQQIASGVNFTAGTITFADSSTISSNASPQVTVYTSGSGTYTVPTGAKYLTVEMVGAGGGGAGCGPENNASMDGGVGGTTTFGSSLLTCTGGGGGTRAITSYPSSGGTPTLNSPATGVSVYGGSGSGGNSYNVAGYAAGMMGAGTPFGGGGASAVNQSGFVPPANTGSGGGGGGTPSGGGGTGGGGGAGAYIKAIISSPSATYSYTVGSGGTAGVAGTGGFTGAAGAAGRIVVTAYF